MKTTSQLRNTLHRFFFATEAPFGMALMRIFLPLAAGLPMVMRAARVRELFTTDGAATPLVGLNGVGYALPVLSPAVAVPLYGIMLACLLLTAVGFRTRLSLLIATPLYIYFNSLDTVSTLTKYSVISSHLLVLLTVSQCGAVWSIDAFLKNRRQRDVVPPQFAVWPARLAQILFAFLYFGAAITKMQTPGFFSGAQLRYWMLTNWNYGNPLGELMAMWTPVLLIGAYMTMLWELLFCTVVWQRALRIPVLLLGVGFHLATSVMLGLAIFPAICLAGYLSFMTEHDIVRLRRFFQRMNLQKVVAWPLKTSSALLERLPGQLPTAIVWSCAVGIGAIGLAEYEVQADLYGMGHANAGMELLPIDAKVAATMIRGQRRIREKDKFFDFAIGTFTVGKQLANREDQFDFGDTILAQCSLNPPHEDLWVECLVEDSEGRTIEQFGQFVQRESMLADFSYRLGNKLLPGQYDIVLKSANQEIARRRFQLNGATAESDAGLLTN